MKAVVGHTAKVYEILKSQANLEEIGDEAHFIFRGKYTDVFKASGVAQSYYSEILRQLEGQHCITYLQRGSRSIESVILVHAPPTPEGHLLPRNSPLTDPERYANLREDAEGLKTLVGGVNVPIALLNIDERLTKIEKALGIKSLDQTKR